MAVRLAFSVAVQVDADIILVDEVLAVGDAAFQHKCFDRFHTLKQAGKTIVFVTHDMSAVQRFCDRAMLLERGAMAEIGDPYAIASAYNELNFGQLPSGGGLFVRGDRAAEIRGAWFEDPTGQRISSAPHGTPVSLCVEVLFNDAVARPRVHFHLRNAARHTVFATSTELHPLDTGAYEPGDVAVFRVRMENWLAPGRYDLSPTLAAHDAGPGDALDVRENTAAFVVPGAIHFDGVVDLPHSVDVERRP
jgi:hypothetical protein